MAKILVIEDERATRTNIVNFLESEGFKTLAAENGRLGIQLAQEHLPDLIICDILMPELDGYDVLTTLQQEAQTASIPFIFLTITATEAGFRQSLDLGADDYLSKPITSDQLRAAISAQLRKQEHRQGDSSSQELATDPTTQDFQQFLQAKDQLFHQLSTRLQQQLASLSQRMQALKQRPAEEAERHLNDLQEDTARMLLLINEIAALHSLLTPENAVLLLEQFDLTDGLDRRL